MFHFQNSLSETHKRRAPPHASPLGAQPKFDVSPPSIEEPRERRNRRDLPPNRIRHRPRSVIERPTKFAALQHMLTFIVTAPVPSARGIHRG